MADKAKVSQNAASTPPKAVKQGTKLLREIRGGNNRWGPKEKMRASLAQIVQETNSLKELPKALLVPLVLKSRHEPALESELEIDGVPPQAAVGLVHRLDVLPHLRAFEPALLTCATDAAGHVTHVTFAPHIASPAQRSAAVAEILAAWRAQRRFACLQHWRDELMPVFAPAALAAAVPGDASPALAFAVERSGAGLFGIRTYGCHLNGLLASEDGGPPRVWLGRRSLAKSHCPGKLDTLVGGGLKAGDAPWDTLVREAAEEAALNLSLGDARPVGIVAYSALDPVSNIILDTEFVYDANLAADWRPTPADGEVSEFLLVTLPEALDRVRRREFMPEAALVIIHLCLRLGVLTPETEPDYVTLAASLCPALPLCGPSFDTTSPAQ